MIPKVPVGTEIQSLICAIKYLGLTGSSTFLNDNVIRRAQELSNILPLSYKSILDILLENTTLPLTLATLGASGIEDVQRLFAPTKFVRSVVNKRLLMSSASRYRRCRHCIDEDMNYYGFAFGRVLHQLPFLQTCYKHGANLEDECAVCGAGFSPISHKKPYKRTLHVCYKCGSKYGTPLMHAYSGGYESLITLVAQGFQECVPELTPREMKGALDRFADLTLEHGIDLLPMFAEFWAVERWEEACAQTNANKAEIRQALLFGYAPAEVLSVYILASFFKSEIKNNVSLPNGKPQKIPNWKFKTAFLIHNSIHCSAHDFGMPMRVVYNIALGDWVGIGKLGYCLKEVRRFVASLDGWEQLFLHARRAIFLKDRLSKININGGKLSRLHKVKLAGHQYCHLAPKIIGLCKILNIACEVRYVSGPKVGCPVVMINGTKLTIHKNIDIVGYAIQRTHFWPAMRRRKLLMVPHVSSA